MKGKRVAVSLLLTLAVIFSAVTSAAFAEGLELEIPVYIDGLLEARGRLLDGQAYIAPDSVCERLGIPMEYDNADGRLSLMLPGVTVEGDRKNEYFTADGRYIYAPGGWICDAGHLYLPADAIARIFGIKVSVHPDGGVELDTREHKLIRGGENYYELNYEYHDLYWLTQIIFSEANLEPMEGKLAVGNVVLNRVRSEDYPDDVFSVLFQIGTTVQFEPVGNGRIHDEANEQSFIAACLCLEGTDVINDPDCLFFVSVDTNITWFRNRLDFVRTIGRHDFYKIRREV